MEELLSVHVSKYLHCRPINMTVKYTGINVYVCIVSHYPMKNKIYLNLTQTLESD